jgi:hypothetical protein
MPVTTEGPIGEVVARAACRDPAEAKGRHQHRRPSTEAMNLARADSPWRAEKVPCARELLCNKSTCFIEKQSDSDFRNTIKLNEVQHKSKSRKYCESNGHNVCRMSRTRYNDISRRRWALLFHQLVFLTVPDFVIK